MERAMSDDRLSGVLRHLGGAALLCDGGLLTDGQLLERFLRDRDQAAFEALVRRYGPMVLGVCRRLLGDPHDADDAFQTTFLVLVYKAASVMPRELVGHWLYGVAHRTALKARRLALRRRAREKQVARMPQREVIDPEPVHDLRALLDQELSRLPEAYRVPVVLCELGGKTKNEVAQQLGVPEGTVSSRLARGRGLLQKRLARHGTALTAAAMALALSEAASAVVPAERVRSTIKIGLLVATDRAAAASVPAACLLTAVLREILIAKLRKAAVVLLVLALVGLAAGALARWAFTDKPPDSPQVAAPALAPPSKVEVPQGPVQPLVVRIADINPDGAKPSWLVNVNGTLFFSGGSVHGAELWKSTPTPSGPVTVQVKRINQGGYSNPTHLTNVNGTLFFTADDGVHGRELWRSDGTAAGTVMVKDINPGRGGSFPAAFFNLVVVGRTLFFVANDGKHGDELWKSDGTEAGTVVVKHLAAGYSVWTSMPRAMANVNGTLFFVANDGKHGIELWKSDGTEAGTVLVKDIHPGGNSSPTFLTNVNGTLFFVADDGVHGRELWKSDGTEAGTILVKDIRPGPDGAFPVPHIGHLTAVGKTLFFAADDGKHGRQLWKSDGTAAGTLLVKDISRGRKKGPRLALDSEPMTAVNGTLYFAADDGAHGRQLWRSDGTEAGTRMLKLIASGGKDANPHCLTDVNGTLFFTAGDGTHCLKLWMSDGTEKGTVPIDKDFFPASAPEKPGQWLMNLVVVDDLLFFVAEWHDPARLPGNPWDPIDLWYLPVPKHHRPSP
jgi:RNA polymerase sigma factor (sigma-70 family)